jgi:hypothetical protein
MRAQVLCGFCISPGVHAEIGQVVDLPDAFYKEMLFRGAITPAPAEPVQDEPLPVKPTSKSSK